MTVMRLRRQLLHFRQCYGNIMMQYENILEPSDLKSDDLIILLMGPSGGGKTHIINKFTNCPNQSSSSVLVSYTSQVTATRIKAHPKFNDRVVLVDTPGFDNTEMTDIQILELIEHWLSSDKRLSGILYVDQIFNTQPSGARILRMRMLREFCGMHAAKNLVFVTTMWDNPHAGAINVEWERQHKEWIAGLVIHGAKYTRFLNTSTSAMKIIEDLLRTHHDSPIMLQDISSIRSLSQPFIHCENLDNPTDLTKDDIVIVVMGPTGTGKSNFIDQLTGLPNKRSGSTLTSWTTDVGAVRIHNHVIYENKIVIVDTPGLNDTNKSDEEVIRVIVTWLQAIVKNGASVHAIVYLHRITDVRMAGGFEQFENFFGQGNPRHVFLVTTMWDELITMEIGAKREQDLSGTCWKSMINGGASMYRFQNSLHSARQLLADILIKLLDCDSERKNQWNLFMAKPQESEEHSEMTATLGTNQNLITGIDLDDTELCGVQAPLTVSLTTSNQSQPPSSLEEHHRNRSLSNRFHTMAESAKTDKKPNQNSAASITTKFVKTFKRVEKLKVDDMIIVFMGPTGSGKSNLIDTIAGQPSKRANVGLRSATSAVNSVRISTDDPFYKSRLVLVDTPGFDDTNKTDFEILEIISKFLVKTYTKHVKITGVVYLHRIDNRIAETLHRSFHVFTKICGENAVKNVALVTTMWDEIDLETGKEREKEVENKLWGTMKDAHHLRFDNTYNSAWEVIEELTKHQQSDNHTVLSLQTEMVKEKMKLMQTKAAQALFTPLNAIIAEQGSLSRQDASTQSAEERANTLLNETIANQAAIDALLSELHNKPSPFGRKTSNQLINTWRSLWGVLNPLRGSPTSSR